MAGSSRHRKTRLRERARQRYRKWLERQLTAQLTDAGQYLLIVPHWAWAAMSVRMWELSVERWAIRWDARDSANSLAAWQRLMLSTHRIPARYYAPDSDGSKATGEPPG